MKHEYDDRPISKVSRLSHCCHKSLFFLIIEMTWRRSLLSHKLDDFGWIMPDAFCGQQPCKVPLETDQATIDRTWLEMKHVLQVGTVISERGCGDRFGRERRFFLSS